MWALARKRDLIPCALRTLGGHVPAVPAQGFDLVPFLVDVEPAARHTVPRRPLRGFLRPMIIVIRPIVQDRMGRLSGSPSGLAGETHNVNI